MRQLKSFPKGEQFDLVSQMHRAAVSIAANITEGAARQSDKEFLRFLYVALGSASELNTEIEISLAVGLGEKVLLTELQSNTDRQSRLLQGLIRTVKTRVNRTQRQPA